MCALDETHGTVVPQSTQASPGELAQQLPMRSSPSELVPCRVWSGPGAGWPSDIPYPLPYSQR